MSDGRTARDDRREGHRHNPLPPGSLDESMRPAIVWILLSLIWGSTWLFMKMGLDDLPPITFAGLRFAIAAAALAVPVAMRGGQRLGGRDMGFIAWTGLLTFSVSYGLVFWGQQYIASGLAALLFATFPLFGLLVAHRVLPAERMTLGRVVGVLAGITGVGIVFSNQLATSGLLAFWGGLAVLLSALVSAIVDIAIKRHGGHLDPVVLTLGQMVAGSVPLLAAGLAIEGNPLAFRWTPRAVVALLYLALAGSAVAFVLLYWLIQRIHVTKTMLITLVTPLIAVLLGVLILREEVTWRLILGGSAILGGVAVTTRSRAALPPPAAVLEDLRAASDTPAD